MGKDLYPRFKCPLCGWMAHLSMLEKAPHKIEITGTHFGGFQEISYHRMWGGKKQYKAFLREKVRELADYLGMQIAGDEEYELDKEVEDTEVEDLEFERDVEIETPAEANNAKSISVGPGADEIENDTVDRQQIASLFQFISKRPMESMLTNPVSHAVETDSEFVEWKERRVRNG